MTDIEYEELIRKLNEDFKKIRSYNNTLKDMNRLKKIVKNEGE